MRNRLGFWFACLVVVAPVSSSSAQGTIGGTASGRMDVYDEYEAPPAENDTSSTDSPAADEDAFRAQNSEFGPVGGVHVVDAGSGAPGTFRLQLGFSYFSTSQFLETGDESSRVGGVLSLSWTFHKYFEIWGALANRATQNSKSDPKLLQVLGDTVLGIKGYYPVAPWFTLGGDVGLTFLNAVGGIGLRLSGTNFGIRFNTTADLRRLQSPVPLIFRTNVGYVFDNSANLVEDVEKARAAAYGEFSEQAQVTRAERFGLGINRVDHVGLGLGLEVPLQLGSEFFLHPLAEYTLNIGANRQGYSCLQVATSAGVGERDGCLALQGLAAMPSTLTIGGRVYPPLRGLAVLLALDIGLSGTSVFVRELAPNAPYDVRIALSYAYDPEPPPAAEPQEIVREVEVTPDPLPRIEGRAVDSESQVPIAGAAVRYAGTEFTAQMTDDLGQFISYPLPAGDVEVQFTHPDYEPGSCTVTMPSQGKTARFAEANSAEPATAESASPEAAAGEQAQASADAEVHAAAPDATSSPDASADHEGPLVPLRCALVAKPRFGEISGTVVDTQGAAVAGASVQLSGPAEQTATTDAAGAFAATNLPAGEYTVRVEAAGFMIRLATVTVAASGTATMQLQLSPQPKTSQVEMSASEVKIRRQIMFNKNSSVISERSHELLREIADVLLRNPQVELVEIQGHTDNQGEPELNRQLSQLRAESVKKFLTEAGVAADRLDARGYGDTRPLVPNLTEANRARNRRVQFIIRKTK